MTEPSVIRRQEIVAALRAGTVPKSGLEHFAVGLAHFETALDEELARVSLGRSGLKAVRGDYGAGKTFFSRWVQHRARQQGFATAEVQISETETPLHRMETVYRRAVENLRTKEWSDGAFHSLIDRWFYDLEEEALAAGGVAPDDPAAVADAVGELLEKRLADVSATQPQFAAALRAVHRARVAGDRTVAEGLLAWLAGQPNVGADIKRKAGLKGEVDHFGALGFLRGLLSVLRQTGRKGLLLVLDEVETIQRVRGDIREKSLNGLRNLVDDVTADRFPGLYVIITGTPAFFDGPQGIRRAEALASRLRVTFREDGRDSTRAIQVRLLPFDRQRLVEVGCKIRDLYPSRDPERLRRKVPDAIVESLAAQVTGKLGSKTGVAPRLFLKKLVGELLDIVEEHEDFDPAADFALSLDPAEMLAEERAAAGLELSAEDIELDLGRE